MRYSANDAENLILLAFSCFESFSHCVVREVCIFLFINSCDCIFLISFVFSTNRQADCTVLTVNTGELSFNVVAYVQNQSGIFNAVTGSFRSAQVTFYAVSQFYGCAFRVNCSDFTVYDCAFLVQCNPVVERIFCELFNAGEIRSRSASTCRTTAAISSPFCIHELLLRLQRSGDVRQVNRAIDAAVRADEDTEVSDRLDFTFNTVALVVGFRELLPWVVLHCFRPGRYDDVLRRYPEPSLPLHHQR